MSKVMHTLCLFTGAAHVTLCEMRMLLVSRRLPLSDRGASSARLHTDPPGAHGTMRTMSLETSDSDSEASELHEPPQAAAPLLAPPQDAHESAQGGARSAGDTVGYSDAQLGAPAPAGASAPGDAQMLGNAHGDALGEDGGPAGSDASSEEWAAARAARPRQAAHGAASAGPGAGPAGAEGAADSRTELAAGASGTAALELGPRVRAQVAPASQGDGRRPQATAQRAPWGRRNPSAASPESHGMPHAAWRGGGQPAHAAAHPIRTRPAGSAMATAPTRLPRLGAPKALSLSEHAAQADRSGHAASPAATVQSSGADAASGDRETKLQNLQKRGLETTLACMASACSAAPTCGLAPRASPLLTHVGLQPHAVLARGGVDPRHGVHATASRERAATPDPGLPTLGSWQAGMQPVPALSGIWLSRPGTPLQ